MTGPGRTDGHLRLRLEELEDRTLPSFTLAGSYSDFNEPTTVTLADVNNDGRLDILSASGTTYGGGGDVG